MDQTLKNLQKYLEYIRYNSTDFGLRLLEPFNVFSYSINNGRYRAILNEKNSNDCYWIPFSEYTKFIEGKLSNTVSLKFGNAFKENDKFGYYMSLSDNNLESEEEYLKFLFGLRFKLNDIFYKIEDVSFINLKMPNGDVFIDDKVKIYIKEDFTVKDFLEINKFIDTSKYVKKGMGYSIEIDGEVNDEYVLLSDAKKALDMIKKECHHQINNKLNKLFPFENNISKKVKEIIDQILIDDL